MFYILDILMNSFMNSLLISKIHCLVKDDNSVYFKDIVALVCLLKNPGLRQRKRLYINSKPEFASYFQEINYNKLPEIFVSLQQKKEYELRSPLEFIMQPK